MNHLMPSRVRLGACALAALLVAGAVALADGASQDPDPLKTALEKCGLNFSALKDAAGWKVQFDAKDKSALNVYVTYNDDKRQYALLFVTVIHKPGKFEFGRDVLVECMKLNNDHPGCKFCLDYSHGELDCQSELLMSTLTPESLKLHLNLLARIADDNGPKLRDMVK